MNRSETVGQNSVCVPWGPAGTQLSSALTHRDQLAAQNLPAHHGCVEDPVHDFSQVVLGRPSDIESDTAHGRERRERARAEMSWKIQPQRSSSTALLHRGGCATYPDQAGLISREDAMVALAEPDIELCGVCRPHTGLMRGQGPAGIRGALACGG
ncbi:DUF6233 domain-containing protein [Streptomyces sp. NPDC102402]|uniref:DUF6233 domain-containing protein n=1 Tax=Streptomyces sp. NPDC102402 TaxID=3366169 RepID=UPI00381E4013